MERKAAHIKKGRICKGANTCGQREAFCERGKGDRGFRMVCESVYGGGTTGIWQLLSRLVLRPCAGRSTHPRLFWWYSEPHLCWNSRRFESVMVIDFSSRLFLWGVTRLWRDGEFSWGWIVASNYLVSSLYGVDGKFWNKMIWKILCTDRKCQCA